MHTNLQPRSSRLYWTLQGLGWGGYAALTLLSYGRYLTGPYAKLHQGAMIAMGFIASLVLHHLCRWLWNRAFPLWVSTISCIAVAYGLTVIGSAIRLEVGSTYLHVPDIVEPAEILAASWSITVLLIAWTALYFGIRYHLAAEEVQRQLQAAELSTREAQLRALQFQLQPHYLFNVLNAISSLVASDQKEAATQMISRIATLLRDTLDDELRQVAPLREELQLAEEFLAIERVRFGPRLQVDFEISPSVYDASVPRWLLQPLLENAVQHSGIGRSNLGLIIVRAVQDQNCLVLEVHNDLDTERWIRYEAGMGIGLVNTRKRLENLYGSRSSLNARHCNDRHFVVVIRIPLNNDILEAAKSGQSA